MCFFHIHGDFTPVCTTEIIAFERANEIFKKRNTCLIGLSVDSNSSHLAWIYDIYCKTGIRVSFPIIADMNGIIARKYGMISSNLSTTETVRNVYIIDSKGIIRTILIYPMTIGRSIPEIIRIIDAAQTVDCNGGVTPANWHTGEPIIVSVPNTFKQLEERVQEIKKNHNGLSWYLSFKEPKEC